MSSAGNIKATAADFVTEVVKKVSVDSLLTGTSALCAMCLGGPIPALTSTAGIVASMALFGALKLKKAAKDRAKDQEQAKHCERVAQLLEQLKNGTSAAREQLAEVALQQQWFRNALEKGPADFNKAWKNETAACADALKHQLADIKSDTTQIQATLAELAHLEFDTNWRIREVALVLQDHGQKLDANTDLLQDQGQKLDTHTDLLNQILSHVKPHPSREEIEREIRPRLEQEIEAKLRREQSSPGVEDLQAQAKRLADIAITALNTKGFAERAAEVGGAAAVLEGLQKQAAAHESAARHHIDASIEIWRKTAEWAYLVGEIETAAESLRKILALRPNDAGALNDLGLVMRLRGELDEASRLFTLVGKVASDDTLRAYSLGNLGLVERDRGNRDAAAANLEQSLALFEKLGDQRNKAIVVMNLGSIEYSRGDLNAAEMHFNVSLPIVKRFGLELAIASNQHGLGLVNWMRGELEAAEALQRESLDIHERLHAQMGIASNYTALGLIEQARGAPDTAERYHKIALKIHEKLGSPDSIKNNCAALGLIEAVRGNMTEARLFWTRCLEMSQKIDNKAYTRMVQSWLDSLPSA